MCKVPKSVYHYSNVYGYDKENRDYVDHFGKHYHSIKEKCRAYETNEGQYKERKRNNWPEEAALVVPYGRDDPFAKCLNAPFKDLNEMFEKTSIKSVRTLNNEFKKGKAFKEICEQALQTERKKKKRKPRIDASNKNKNQLCPIAYIYGAKYQGKIVYVGQTIQTIEKRARQHLYAAKTNPETKFQYFLAKHGKEVTFEPIEILKDIKRKNIDEAEIEWIKHYDTYHNGKNSTPGGESSYCEKKKLECGEKKIITFLWKVEEKSIKYISKETNISYTTIKNFLSDELKEDTSIHQYGAKNRDNWKDYYNSWEEYRNEQSQMEKMLKNYKKQYATV